MKKILSQNFTLTEANIPSLVKSAGIVIAALVALSILDYLFPSFEVQSYTSAVVALTGAWLVNLVKEFVEKK